VLIEGSPGVLHVYGEDLSLKAKAQLERLGVEVSVGKPVSEITSEGVRVDGHWIATKTVIWAAGVASSPLGRTLGVPVDRVGRVIVEKDLTVPGHDNVYVIGDLASIEQDGHPVPGIAPAAMQGGRHAAANLLRSIAGKPRRPFHYHDKGQLATIGRGAAVAHIGRIRASGYFAWLLWLFVHILFLIGFRNRLIVLIQWAWSFFTFDRGARLITEISNEPLLTGSEEAEKPSSGH
jgi:NADH dehydrogenase